MSTHRSTHLVSFLFDGFSLLSFFFNVYTEHPKVRIDNVIHLIKLSIKIVCLHLVAAARRVLCSGKALRLDDWLNWTEDEWGNNVCHSHLISFCRQIFCHNCLANRRREGGERAKEMIESISPNGEDGIRRTKIRIKFNLTVKFGAKWQLKSIWVSFLSVAVDLLMLLQIEQLKSNWKWFRRVADENGNMDCCSVCVIMLQRFCLYQNMYDISNPMANGVWLHAIVIAIVMNYCFR